MPCEWNGHKGHNAVSYAWLRALQRLGYEDKVTELPLGVDKNGAQVKADGVAKSFDASATLLVWDTRVSRPTSRNVACRTTATSAMFAVTDLNERLSKIASKAGVCASSFNDRVEFLPVVCNSHGGLGRVA